MRNRERRGAIRFQRSQEENKGKKREEKGKNRSFQLLDWRRRYSVAEDPRDTVSRAGESGVAVTRSDSNGSTVIIRRGVESELARREAGLIKCLFS